MSLTRRFLFSSIPVVAIWLAIEGGLRLAGVATALERDDPYVGFEAALPLFVPGEVEDEPAAYVTASNKKKFFNAQKFVANKTAETRRVFCLGGSTTYGRPYDDATSFCGFMRVSLEAIEPSVDWQVVNAGGISYASYRVASVVDEITRYAPDLLVVYTGHNEFLEERTYRGLRTRSSWRNALDRRLRTLRSYSVLESVFEESMADAGSQRDTLSAEVETRLDSSIGLDAYTRDDELAVHVDEHFRMNLERIVRRSRQAGAEVLLVVPAGNLADSAPFKSELSPHQSSDAGATFYNAFDTGVAAHRDGDLARAEEMLAHAVSLDPRHAHARYEYGRVLVARGQHAKGRREFVAARDEDVCPLRARSEISDTVRDVATRLDVGVVDFPALIVQRSGPDASPHGADWFLDHVHPTIEGNRVLARAILGELHRMQWLQRDPNDRLAAIEQAEQRVRDGIDEVAHGISLRNLAKVLSWAGKTEEAARAAGGALDLLGDDAESLFILSLDASELGDHRRAVTLLREALRLDPEWVKPRLNLGVELSRGGRLEAALEAYDEVIELAPDHPSVHYNRGHVLARLGRMEEAAVAYRMSLRMNPSDEDARFELARLLPSKTSLDEGSAGR